MQEKQKELMATHRFCICHVKANFNMKFKSKELKKLMYKASIATKTAKCDSIMEDIKSISKSAYNWVVQVGLQKWTLAYDGGYRYGCMTMNLSE